MNRRDMLKGIVAAPVVAVVAPLAIANGDGVALTSIVHPLAFEPPSEELSELLGSMQGDFDTANMRYKSHELTNRSLVASHRWDYMRDRCTKCGATMVEFEDNLSPWCYIELPT